MDEFELHLDSATRFWDRIKADAMDVLQWAVGSLFAEKKDRRELETLKKALRRKR